MAEVATGNWEVAGDSDWFSVELVAGQSYTLGIDGVAGGAFRITGPEGFESLYESEASTSPNANGHYTATTSGTYWFSTTGVATGNYNVILNAIDDDFADNSNSRGKITSGGASVAGRAEAMNDSDWFATQMQTGREYTFKVVSEGNFDVFVASKDGIILTPLNVDAGGTGKFVPQVAGEYFIVVKESGDAVFARPVRYDLQLTDVAVTDDYGQTPATAGAIALNAAGVGAIDARLNYGTDSDWFAVEVKAGETYRVRISGTATGTDGFLGVVDPDGIYQNIPGAFGRQTANETSFTATQDGVYYVTATAGRMPTNYHLEVAKVADDFTESAVRPGAVTVGGTTTGKFEAAFDTDWFAVQVVQGQSYSMTAAVAGTRSPYFALGQFVDATGKLIGPTFTATTTGTVYVEVTGYTSTPNAAVTGYNVGVQAYADDYADNASTTGTIAIGGSAKGNIQAQQDSDWFKVTLVEGKSYVFAAGGGFLPPNLTLYDADGVALSFNGVYTAQASGTYFLSATGFLNGAYTLTAREYVDDYVDYDASDGVFQHAPGYGGNGEVIGGTDAANTLEGTTKGDWLQGRGGNDTLMGGGGNDVLDGGAGGDRMLGGTGNDTYVVDAKGDRVIERANQGQDTVNSSISYRLGDNVENLFLTGDADLNGTGNALGNAITGNAGNNVLSGGASNDMLRGGAGIDQLTGGTGADVFAFAAGDSGATRAGADSILDFNRDQGDKIDLSAIDAKAGAFGNQAFAFIGNTAFSGTAGELRTATLGGEVYVMGDTDGNGQADFLIHVDGNPVLIATDFVL